MSVLLPISGSRICDLSDCHFVSNLVSREFGNSNTRKLSQSRRFVNRPSLIFRSLVCRSDMGKPKVSRDMEGTTTTEIKIITSPQDKKLYKRVQLKNGMQVLLISDPDILIGETEDMDDDKSASEEEMEEEEALYSNNEDEVTVHVSYLICEELIFFHINGWRL